MTKDVLIVGANPTGLILACKLLQSGVKVKVIDSRKDPYETSFFNTKQLPIVLSTSSLELLHSANLLNDDLFNKSHPVIGTKYNWKNRSLKFKFNPQTTSPTPNAIIITYHEFELSLLQEFSKLGGSIDWGMKLVTLVNHNVFIEKVVNTTDNFENREVLSPQWIIACESETSEEIKDIIKNDIKLKKCIKENYLINCSEGSLDENYLHLIPLSKHFLNYAFYNPIAKTKQLWMLGGHHNLSEKLRKKLKYCYQIPILEDFKLCKTTLYTLPTEFQNILFLGSFANSLTFSHLSGINTNIRDAFNISWKLIPVLKKAAPVHLISIKEEEKTAYLPCITDTFHNTTKRLPFSNLYTPALIYFLLKGYRKFKPQSSEYFTSQQSLPYIHSSIIKVSPKDKEIEGPKPGNRAIDALLDDGSFLLDSLKSSKHLLLFFKERPDLKKAIEEEYGDWVESKFILNPQIMKLYHATPETLFIIRPDRYIGYRTHEFKLRELISYLLRIFSLTKEHSETT